MGPFTYGGVIHSNGDIGFQGRKPENRVAYTGNNHGSLVEINGHWYIFGHRMTNYTAFSRQGVAEPVSILEDGSIPQVEMTSGGLGGVLPGKGIYEARIACQLFAKEGAMHYDGASEGKMGELLRKKHPVFRQDGTDREENSDQHIANIQDGTVIGFKYFKMEKVSRISVTTRGDGGSFRISTSEKGSYIAEITLEAGTDWHESEPTALHISDGKQALYFTYFGEGKIDFIAFRLE